ncbi:MAG: GntR family transcriptional regulator [Thermoleophilia bacterium]
MGRLLNDGDPPLAQNASHRATELIREAIMDGRLEPGRRLKEEELARDLGISRTPVREALLILQTEGLIEALPNRGATVRAYRAEDLVDMYGLRAVLEGHAARMAATRITRDQVALLRDSVDRFDALRECEEIRDLIRENQVFHTTIHEAAGSDRLIDLLRKVVEFPLVYRSFIWYSQEQKLISLHYHRQIASALEARDADRAELIMKEHVYEACDFLSTQLQLNMPQPLPEEAE